MFIDHYWEYSLTTLSVCGHQKSLAKSGTINRKRYLVCRRWDSLEGHAAICRISFSFEVRSEWDTSLCSGWHMKSIYCLSWLYNVYGNRTISHTVPRIHVFLTVHKLSYVDQRTHAMIRLVWSEGHYNYVHQLTNITNKQNHTDCWQLR